MVDCKNCKKQLLDDVVGCPKPQARQVNRLEELISETNKPTVRIQRLSGLAGYPSVTTRRIIRLSRSSGCQSVDM